MLLLLLILATSLWGLSKLWGGGVPKLDIDHYGPRIFCLLLRAIIELNSPYPPTIWSTVSPTVFFCPASARDHLTTRASPVSIPAYQENSATFPYLTRHHHSPTITLPPCPHHAWPIIVAAATTLLPKYILAWSSAAVLRPSNATTAHVTPIRPHILSTSNIPQILAVGHPLRYLLLPPLYVIPNMLGPCCPEHPIRPLLYPSIDPKLSSLDPHHMPQETHVYPIKFLQHLCRQHPYFWPK